MGVSPDVERSERRAGRRSSTQRGRIVVIVLALLLVVLFVWWLTSRSSGSDGGSLASKGGGSMSVPVSAGAPMSVGMLELSNDGGSEIVIDRISLVDPTTGMRIVGMYAQPAGEAELGFSGGFKWPRGASEVEGLALKPDGAAGYRLVLGVQVDAQGIYRSPGIRVAYHSGDKTHETALRLSMTLCAPPRLYRNRCAESS
jgi:hypothetical protein